MVCDLNCRIYCLICCTSKTLKLPVIYRDYEHLDFSALNRFQGNFCVKEEFVEFSFHLDKIK
jgi:hypothetical protein